MRKMYEKLEWRGRDEKKRNNSLYEARNVRILVLFLFFLKKRFPAFLIFYFNLYS